MEPNLALKRLYLLDFAQQRGVEPVLNHPSMARLILPLADFDFGLQTSRKLCEKVVKS